MGLFSARIDSAGQKGGGYVLGRKLSQDGVEGLRRGKLLTGGCHATSSHACLLFENFFECFGVEDAFRPAV